jgi:hypothetical protein
MSTSSTVRRRPGFATGVLVALIAMVAVVTFLVQTADSDDGPGATVPATEEPAHVEHVEGSQIARVTLTASAAERIDVQTDPVRSGSGPARLVVPYGALLYDANGRTWVYTSPDELVYERAPIAVVAIRGERVLARRGPQPGTEVVVVGAAELWGAEFGVGH